MAELLFLQPVFKQAVWGGKKLEECFGYEIPSAATGECWAVSAHPNGDCIVSGGIYGGESLSRLWSSHPELFGNEDGRLGDQFPLLVKIIDAQDDLSIQVHPGDAYAKEHENGSLGKTECWYVLDCTPGASIVIGHHAESREELEQMTEEKRWKDLIREVPVKKGDFFQISPGCVHAIKAGTLILETQQSSDITYRMYDYDRMWNGSLRDLHTRQCMDVINVPFVPVQDQTNRLETRDVDKEHLVTCDYYTVEKYDIHGTWNHKFQGAFTNVSVLEGEGTIDGVPLKKGTHFIIPFGYNICEIKGQLSLICSWVPDQTPVSECKEDSMSLGVYDWMGRLKAREEDEEQAVLAFEDIYEEGDFIKLTVPRTEAHYVVRIDDTMDESLVYMTKKSLDFEIPFEERKKSCNPKSFTGRRHYLTFRPAEDYEIYGYRNLAKNVMDQHGDRGCYPHASANVETRGESVFAARNAIDGVLANRSHGSWPYASWGINKRQDAQMFLDFGRPVDFDRIVLWTRADFPHDNWWVEAELSFSDGTREIVKMEKSRKPHGFQLKKKNITWISLGNLIQSDDPSPFPALTQIEVYGREPRN